MSSSLLSSLSPSPSAGLWSSSTSSSCSSSAESGYHPLSPHSPPSPSQQRRPITGSHHLSPSLTTTTTTSTPRSGPSSPSNFLLPGVINANKSPASSTFSSPWSSGSGGPPSPTNCTSHLSPSSSGLWNRGRSAPNLAGGVAGSGGGGGGVGVSGSCGGVPNNPFGHGLNSAFAPFSQSAGSPWASLGVSTTPVSRKGLNNHHTYGMAGSMTNPTAAAAGYMANGQNGFGGSRFRRSTSYPGKNNVFGSTQFHMAPPTLEVTNIDENSDYMYQDPHGSITPSPLDNMRGLEYYLHDMMHNTVSDGQDQQSKDCFGMNGGNYLPSLSIHSQPHCLPSPSRISPRSPVSTSGSESGERYSRKVFVGGLPPDIDEEEINASFRRFGSLVVDWPHKAESKSYFPPKGYAFLLFQEENSVQQLIETCMQEEDKLYLCVSSPTIKDKPVQIRPWKLSDADFVLDASLPLDPRKTVFVGGVPRPLKAVELALIMDRLYGGVCYAGIDIDPELKYPKGAGRVAFSNQQSYIAAISARFVQLQHGDIDKRVEVKPYVLDDQFCDECQGSRSAGRFAPFFCANVTCLQYYCEHCWAMVHSRPGREFHKPLVKEGADRPRTVHFRW
ncbi:translational regulator orb2 isoform X3 [Daphnia magna]|uniref:translational regulator orb2 isoform X3 n=1 Tax=Daphnia magna TaxID=35525 RepID=UPI001E1BDC2E|nr:translational regulator orb2 isoform X3 [Daphnia magna]